MGKKMKKGKRGKKKKKKKKKKAKCPVPEPPKVYRHPMEPCTGPTCDIENYKEILDVQPNHYPGFLRTPEKMAVINWSDNKMEKLIEAITQALTCARRVLIISPWANYILITGNNKENKPMYFLYDGCTCNVNIFRYYDLACGTAGFLNFESIPHVVVYIFESRMFKTQQRFVRKTAFKDILEEYESKQYKPDNACLKFGK